MPNSKRLRVLWLCSWYPSEVEPFSGDFIQRHAEAVGDFADVRIHSAEHYDLHALPVDKA